jgi:threonine dehydrogenase-like Zn-dependent dehydrogenase
MADGAVAQALVLEAPRRLVVRELPLGLCAAAAANEAGAGSVMVTDLGVRNADRLVQANLDDAEDLLATMAGERDDVPPVHGVLTS